MINSEHLIVQQVIHYISLVKFWQTIPNKCNQDCRNYVHNISGPFQEILYKKTKQCTTGVNLHQNFASWITKFSKVWDSTHDQELCY